MKHLLFALSLMLVTLVSAQTNSRVKPTNVLLAPDVFDTIKLLKPDTLSGKPLMQAISRRKSDRQFDSRNLSLRHLSDILWVANGINRPDGKRTVASAVGLYPLQTFAVLANGIYFYNPKKHQLEPFLKGDFRRFTGTQTFVETAPLNLLFITKGKTATDNFNNAMLDSGYCGQNVYLYCASEGLRCVVRASVNEAELLKAMNLSSNYKFILAQTVGY